MLFRSDMIKVAAGWLIDQCQFKGVIEGGAQVHPNQALVIINYDEASAVDILKLAERAWYLLRYANYGNAAWRPCT